MTELFGFTLPDEETCEVFYKDYHKHLSTLGKTKVDAISNFKNRSQSFFADIFSRAIISFYYQIPLSELQFSTTGKDKPVLTNQPDIFFNYSHSGKFILLGFGNHEIGVDVESERKNMIKVANRFFSEEEIEYLSSFHEKELDEAFCNLWTIKEAYLKYIGTGLTKSLCSFTVKFDKREIFLFDEDTRLSLNIKLFKLKNNFKAAICTTDNSISSEIKWISLAELEGLLQAH